MSPAYESVDVSVVTVAWDYVCCEAFSFEGALIFFRQLHSLSSVCGWLQSDSSFLLCDEMFVFMFGMQE